LYKKDWGHGQNLIQEEDYSVLLQAIPFLKRCSVGTPDTEMDKSNGKHIEEAYTVLLIQQAHSAENMKIMYKKMNVSEPPIMRTRRAKVKVKPSLCTPSTNVGSKGIPPLTLFLVTTDE